MSSRSELAIKNTDMWLSESPIKHERISHNAFLITDSTDGVSDFKVALSIHETHVKYVSTIVEPLVGSAKGMHVIDNMCLQHNYKHSGPALGKAEDGSIVATADNSLEEYTPLKMFKSLASFEPIQREVGPELLEAAVKNNLRIKHK